MAKKTQAKHPFVVFIEWLMRLIFGDRTGTDEGVGGASKSGPDGPPPYAVRPALMSEVEAEFDAFLMSCIDDDRLVVHRKVRVADILQVIPGSPRWQHWFNRISSKHADFVVCFGHRPIAVIELDDKSHSAKRRQERDRFVDSAYLAASLPILHVPVAASYDRAQISSFIANAAVALTAPIEANA